MTEEVREKWSNATTAYPIFLRSQSSSFLFPELAAFGDPSFPRCTFVKPDPNVSQREDERNYWKDTNLSIFDDFTNQSCSHQRQTDSLSHHSLQNKHQQDPPNVSLESGARMRNEEVRQRPAYCQVSAGSSSIRDHGARRPQSSSLKRMKEDNQRIINRSVFSKVQREGLEDAFSKTKYIRKQQRVMLAQELKLKDFQVKIWFQNRRSKWRNSDNCKSELLQCYQKQSLCSDLS